MLLAKRWKFREEEEVEEDKRKYAEKDLEQSLIVSFISSVINIYHKKEPELQMSSSSKT